MTTLITARHWLAPGILALVDDQGVPLVGVLEPTPVGCVVRLYLAECPAAKPISGPEPDWDWGWGSDTYVGSFFGDIYDAARGVYGSAKGALSSVASFVHHPPGWLAAVFPLFTMENQRYWAQKLGGSTGAKIYDVGVKVVAEKALGPQGPQLVEAYNKVVEDAAQGHVNAQQILQRAPQIAQLAIASRQGAGAFQAAIAKTGSAVKVSGVSGHW